MDRGSIHVSQPSEHNTWIALSSVNKPAGSLYLVIQSHTHFCLSFIACCLTSKSIFSSTALPFLLSYEQLNLLLLFSIFLISAVLPLINIHTSFLSFLLLFPLLLFLFPPLSLSLSCHSADGSDFQQCLVKGGVVTGQRVWVCTVRKCVLIGWWGFLGWAKSLLSEAGSCVLL